MTSRRVGKRSIATERRKKDGKRGGSRQVGKAERLSAKERRQMIQLVACGSIFVLFVAVKLLLPEKIAPLNEKLAGALERNMDVQAVFSAVGRAFSGEEDAAQEVYQAVFRPERTEEALKTSALLPENTVALKTLQQYRQIPLPEEQMEVGAEEASQSEISTLAYVLYSKENLPEDVSLEQALLDFDYCTPVSGTLTSGFGYREHPTEGAERFHYGVDLAANGGTEILCFADGTVTAVGESSSYGKYCIVSHTGGYSTLYAHCNRITTSSGSEVKGGQTIAEVGETGMATGPHLHFELQKNSTYLNPIYYLSVQ